MNDKGYDPQPDQNTGVGENSTCMDDAFNPERLRLSQNFEDTIAVKKVMTAVPVRNPDRQSFVCVHRSPAYRLATAVLELKWSGRRTWLSRA